MILFNATNLKVLWSHCAHIRDAENETYCVKDIGLSTTIQPGDGIETVVPAQVVSILMALVECTVLTTLR